MNPGRRRPFRALARHGEAILDEVAQRSRITTRKRIRRVRQTILPVVQSGVAAGFAWLIATEVFGHAQPFFAPIAALITLGVSLGQRLRRVVELVIGVAVGILVADVLIALIGRGAIQLVAVVVLAMVVAVFAGGGTLIVTQSGASAVLVVALAPAAGSGALTTDRFVDTLIGGGVGLAVNALLLPVNPIVVARRAANPVLDQLAGTLLDVADALAARDREAMTAALTRARAIEDSLDSFAEALDAGGEITRIAPVRWRMQGHLALYVDAAIHIDRAVRNVRVLARRGAVVLRVGEDIDPRLPTAIRRMAEGVRTLRNELAKGFEPLAARRGLVDAAELATAAYGAGPGFSAHVVVAQIRSAVHDLLLASGLEHDDVYEILGDVDAR